MKIVGNKTEAESNLVRVIVLTEHRLNFGTVENPEYKFKDDEISCAPEVAEQLAARGYVEIIKGDETDVK